MKRLQTLENKGWSVSTFASGDGCIASRNNGLDKIKGSSITDLHRKIIGY